LGIARIWELVETEAWGFAGQLLFELLTNASSCLKHLGDFAEHPDLSDDLFLLAGRALSYCPRIVLTPQMLPLLLDTAAAGVLVQHR
jgi:transportin-3